MRRATSVSLLVTLALFVLCNIVVITTLTPSQAKHADLFTNPNFTVQLPSSRTANGGIPKGMHPKVKSSVGYAKPDDVRTVEAESKLRARVGGPTAAEQSNISARYLLLPHGIDAHPDGSHGTTMPAFGDIADFVVLFNTTKGPILMDVHRSWAPLGAQRFHELVASSFFDGVAFFRVIRNFMAQLGINGNHSRKFRFPNIKDDPVVASNARGMVSFAKAGPNTRSTQIFLNFGNNRRLDASGFAPFAQLRNESLKVLDSIYSGYGESLPRGKGPTQGKLRSEGDAYLKQFPLLDWVLEARIVG